MYFLALLLTLRALEATRNGILPEDADASLLFSMPSGTRFPARARGI